MTSTTMVQSTPPLVLCADGGGSKVSVVIRSKDGIEVRGSAGPCNVQSVGHVNAAQALLLATYRALSQLPPTHLPQNFQFPSFPTSSKPANGAQILKNGHHNLPHLPTVSMPASPFPSRPTSPTQKNGSTTNGNGLPALNCSVFQYSWIALAGISTPFDAEAFLPFVSEALDTPAEQVKITNDVNLLAAPSLDVPNIRHVVCVVCGTGTVGRTIRINQTQGKGIRQLPLEDVAVSRGWGYLLHDEGSAFWLGRLAIRLLLAHADRHASVPIFASSPPQLLPLHRDLLNYFKVEDPMDLIEVASLTGRWVADAPLPGDIGDISARRNATVAGAARVVLRWAFPEDAQDMPPSPPSSSTSSGSPLNTDIEDPIAASTAEALRLAKISIEPMIEQAIDLLGDRSIVKSQETALSLGGGLMMSRGYRQLLLDGLKKRGITWGMVQVIDDAAGVGAKGLSSVEFSD